MSRYRRGYRDYYDAGPMQTNFIWDSLTGSYKFQFINPTSKKHWDTLKMVVELIKNKIPYGERDYDDETKIWFIAEQHAQWLYDFLVQLPDITLNFVKKPEGQTSVTTFIPIEVMLDTLKKLSGFDFKGMAKEPAIKQYRRAAMNLHPDRHPDDPDAGAIMSQFNASWQKLQEQGYFK